MKPYAISSDQHLHTWSQFSHTNDAGMNSRLAIILGELLRSANSLLHAGGDTMFLAGDLFHVRGRIEPEVLNPAMDTFREICGMGIKVFAIPGNHDLAGKHAEKLGNAMQALDEIDGFTSVIEPTDFGDVVMLPWIESLDELRQVAISMADASKDLIIHAPLNGVIKGLPDHGLDPVEVAQWGYRRVFIGHYHSHAETATSVYSIGATTHQTWSDPGTLAGFLLVDRNSVTHCESEAPQFVNIDEVDEIDPVAVAGNYVRLRLKDADEDALASAREALKDCGALGWVDHSSKKREVVRGQAGSNKNVTLEVSVANYVTKHVQAGPLNLKRIAVDALDVLREARTVGAE